MLCFMSGQVTQQKQRKTVRRHISNDVEDREHPDQTTKYICTQMMIQRRVNNEAIEGQWQYRAGRSPECVTA